MSIILPQLFITSFAEAADHLRDLNNSVRHLISIGDPDTTPPQGSERCDHILRLTFYDVDYGDLGPTPHHVWNLVQFARNLEGEGGTLLIHCQAGISRSSAAAMTILCAWHGPGSEYMALSKVLALRPQAYPNRLLILHADRLLDRDGAMLEALSTRFGEALED